MTRFLKEPWAPSLLGFDPMMQIVHEDDVVRALVHAVLNDLPGVYNVAAEGVMPLSKLRGLAGKPPMPVFHKFVYWGVALPGGTSRALDRCLPIEPDYIRYPWVGDLSKMREEFGFEPSYTAEETLREFVQRSSPERGWSGSARTAPARDSQPELNVQPSQSDDPKPPAVSEIGVGASGVQ
jgi:UDP-glucose 4-epimerase